MKIWIWGILVFILAGCTALEANTTAEKSTQSGIEPAMGETAAVSQTPLMDEQSLPSPTAGTYRAELEDYGPAPELTNDTWLNVSQPLRLADLRGQVVLIDMWTYG